MSDESYQGYEMIANRRFAEAQCYAAHVADIKRILTEQRCMDSKGQIRSWKRDTWPTLHAAGHDSLDPKICKCCVPHNDGGQR